MQTAGQSPSITFCQSRWCLNGFALTAKISFLGFIFLTGTLGAQEGKGRGNQVLKTTEKKPGAIPFAMQQKCVKCHNPSTQKGELDLSTLEGLIRGGESGDPLLNQDLADARLWQVLEHDEMPPEGEPDLTVQEVEQIKKWMEAQQQLSYPSRELDTPTSVHDVLPILLLRCASCHGGQRQDGGLDVRNFSSLAKGGLSGPAFVAGEPASSLMIQRVESQQCPPSDRLLKFFVKRPSKSELERLQKWIAAGAPRGNVVPDIATQSPDPLVTQEDRQHWAFIPPQRPSWGKGIDDFIADSLEKRGLTFAPKADRETLIRRVYLDLTGLPPSLQDWKKWRENPDPHWYSNLIDDLLDSPRYGERWGRYWLDLAGYADSEGGISADPLRPVAWKYRDYVVRSFNRDTPYDQFLLEQLAGDELMDHAKIDNPSERDLDQLIATGFLRMGIDETGSRTMNFVPERLKVIDDALTIVSSGLMGLTMECARCHSHKYDPIPQRDYYRLKAIFQGALDEHNWKSFKQRKLNLGTEKERESIAQTNPPLEKEKRNIQNQLRQNNDALVLEILRTKYPEQSETDREATLAARGIADNQRTLQQRQFVEHLQLAETSQEVRDSTGIKQRKAKIDQLQNKLEAIEKSMAPSLAIRALWDEGNPSPTYILRRGEHTQFGRLVGPGVPSVLTDGRTVFEYQAPFPDGTKKTGRRLAFAEWLTSKQHPTTARVMVNRVWHHHFGKGLVKTLENLGVMGAKPTHPELLDWLAVEFMANHWSMKELHRQIMTSQTYQQTSRVGQAAMQLDPENQLYSRMPLRRMDAETLRDSLLFVSDRLDLNGGGIPDPVEVDPTGEVKIKPTPDHRWRRSLYAQYRRTEIPTLLDTFDYPQMGPNCFERSISTVSPQALLLLNNQRVHELAQYFSDRLQNIPTELPNATIKGASTSQPTSPNQNSGHWNQVIERAYQIAMSRSPSSEELALGSTSLDLLVRKWDGDTEKALTSYCHALLNSASFLYID